MPITIEGISSSSIDIKWTSIGTSVTSYFVELWQPYDGATNVYTKNPPYGGSQRTHSFYNLSASTRYEIKVYGRNSSGTLIGSVERYSVVTNSVYVPPDPDPAPGSITSFSAYIEGLSTIIVYGYVDSYTSYVTITSNSFSTQYAYPSNGFFSASFSGSPGNRYNFFGRAVNSSGSSSLSDTQITIPLPTPSPISMSVTRNGTTITVSGTMGPSSNTDYVGITSPSFSSVNVWPDYYRNYSTSFAGTQGNTYSFTGRGWYAGVDGPTVTKTIEIPYTPLGPMTTVTRNGITTTSFDLSWTQVTNAASYGIDVRTGEYSTSPFFNSYYPTGLSQRVTGLTPNQSYWVKVYPINGTQRGSEQTFIVKTSSSRPGDWYWTIGKNKGQNYSISNGSFTNLVSRTEIINFQNHINEFRNTYKGLPKYSFSHIATNAVFTAAMYNELDTSIRGMNPSVSTYGNQTSNSTYTVDELLNRLRVSLNSIT